MNAAEVVVTGIGVAGPLGLGAVPSWKALLAGERSRRPVDLFETEGCRCREAAQVPLPAPERRERRLSRASRLALAAAAEALSQAALPRGAAGAMPLALSTTGGAMEWGEAFVRRATAGGRTRLFAPVARYQPQQQVLDLRAAFGLGGPATVFGNACASGANAVGHGLDLIRCGQADVVLAGGWEALTELIFMGFDCLQSLSLTECRPFDAGRDGLQLGEGAAFLVLESAPHARARGAAILGTVLGYGQAFDPHHLTAPAPDGAALVAALRMALADAGAAPEEVAYVNAHGTATPMNDGAEAASYAAAFGAALPEIALGSTKAAVGHALGAAGTVEAVFALLAARDRVAPPQLHTRDPLPEVAASLARCGKPLPEGKAVVSANLGFGGSNAALVFGGPQ
ncbi:MAG TPA: beta-ketoacyl-[acyl-carrier-protein] synthase family protein [Candidatus Methylacidiphilales bacterium]